MAIPLVNAKLNYFIFTLDKVNIFCCNDQPILLLHYPQLKIYTMKTTRKYNPEAETQVPEDGSFVEQVKKEAERIKLQEQMIQAETDSRNNLENKTTELDLTPPSGVKTPKKIKQSSRANIAAILSAAVIGAGVASTGTYAYITRQGPFAPEQQQRNSAPKTNKLDIDKPQTPSVPKEVKNEEDLKNALESENISADDSDFNYPTEQPQLHARALNLKLNPELDGASGPGYEWIPIKNRITELDQKDIIIAVKVVNRYVMEDAQSLLHPKGFTYRAKTVDPKNPNITYFYYNCADKENPSILAQIGLQDPTNPRKLLWARSFDIPACE